MKRVEIYFVILALLLTGCFPQQPAQPALSAPTQVTDLTLPTPNVIFITATSESSAGTPIDLNPQSPAQDGGESINLSQVDDLGSAVAEVKWEVNGNAPYGFRVVWSDVHQPPTYPEDTYTDAGDPNARAAHISGELGKIYYVRVCRVVAGGCDLYSNMGIFALTKRNYVNGYPTYTPFILPTNYTSGVYYKPGVNTSSSSTSSTLSATNYITIASVVSKGTGKALITWDAAGSFANGFRILYSKSHSTPVYGTDPYFGIADGTIRSAYLDGSPGSTYYYRICRFTGSTCDLYSNVYTFAYSGSSTPVPTKTSTPVRTPTTDGSTIAISGFTNTAPGIAIVSWTASGSFPDGFLVISSPTDNPLLEDSTFTTIVPDGSTREASVIAYAGSTAYIRVCKFDSWLGSCTVYSPTVPYLFPVNLINISAIESVDTGQSSVTWTANGDFPNGFAVIFSSTNTTPTLPDDESVTVGEGVLTTTISGTPDIPYHVRVCALDEGGNTYACSPALTFSFAP